ncbi:MAG: hypothetical protein HZB26_06475 [Candidatus Hydrogenedentes bacterium]|nr:hypothetical protein [Candidatus Hydrogenedentota bacterium]
MHAAVVIPVLIMIGLGAISGFVWHWKLKRYWLASAAAALTAGAVWTIGCALFLQFTAPSEGFTGMADAPYAAAALAVTSLVALPPALLSGLVVRGRYGQRQTSH